MDPTYRVVPNEEVVSLREGLASGHFIARLIQVAVILLVLGIIAAIVVPNIVGALEDAKKTADAENMKGLMKAFIDGHSDKKAVPQASGYRFWLALYVGDERAPGDPRPNPSTLYLTPGDASYLVSPADPVADRDRTEAAIIAALAGNGLADLDATHCSYPGPRVGVTSQSRKVGGRIIIITGARNGRGFFEDGYNIIKGNLESHFYRYEEYRNASGDLVARTQPNWANFPSIEPLPDE